MRSLLSKFIQIGTRVWWARVLCKVPESTKLGYQSGYFEKKLMNQPSFQLFIQIGTRAWWARVLHKVPELTKLGYQSGYSLKRGWFLSLFSKNTSLVYIICWIHIILYTHNEVIPWYNNTMESYVELLRIYNNYMDINWF